MGVANTLAYHDMATIKAVIKFYSKGPVGQCYINCFFITSEWVEYARVFVPCRPFQQSLMFKGKDRSLPKKVQAAALFKNALANLVNL